LPKGSHNGCDIILVVVEVHIFFLLGKARFNGLAIMIVQRLVICTIYIFNALI